MDKSLMEDTIGKAIKAASGKSFSEAKQLITAEVMALIEAPAPEVFSISSNEVSSGIDSIPASVVRPTPRIASLKPVGAPPRSVFKQIWTTEQIRVLIEQNTPDVLSFIPEGTDHDAHIYRIINVDTNTPPGVQLSYRPHAGDPDIPFPKFMMFTTDEDWDFPAILDKMAKDAASMYRLRTQPITTKKVSTGGKVIFGTKAEV